MKNKNKLDKTVDLNDNKKPDIVEEDSVLEDFNLLDTDLPESVLSVLDARPKTDSHPFSFPFDDDDDDDDYDDDDFSDIEKSYQDFLNKRKTTLKKRKYTNKNSHKQDSLKEYSIYDFKRDYCEKGMDIETLLKDMPEELKDDLLKILLSRKG